MTNRNVVMPTIWLDAVVVDHEAVAVEINVDSILDGVFRTDSFTGVSKCDPADKFDAQIGADLAYWRAVERAAKKNLDRIAGKVKHNDDIREIRKAQASVNQTPTESITDVIRVPYTDLEIVLDLGKNKISFLGKEYNSSVNLSSIGQTPDNSLFRVGEIAYFETGVDEFMDNYGYVLGWDSDLEHYAVFHPYIEWINGNSVTYWIEGDLA